jgi:hypothetical protein
VSILQLEIEEIGYDEEDKEQEGNGARETQKTISR